MKGEYEEYQAALRPVIAEAFSPRRLPLSSQRVTALCDDLLSNPKRPSDLYLRNSPLVARAEVVQELVHRSYNLRHQDARHAAQIGRLAWRIAEALRQAPGLGLVVPETQCEALANLGNLERVRGRYRRAEVLLARAAALLAEGSGSAGQLALVLRYRASLRGAQQAFGEAVALLVDAECLYQRIGDKGNVAKVRVMLGLTHLYANEPKRALEVMGSLRELLCDSVEPELIFLNLHNMHLCFEALGKPLLALELMEQADIYYRKFVTPQQAPRIWGFRGRLLCSLGSLAEAAVYLEHSRRAFLERKLPYDAAIASLDLALVYARQRKPHLVYQLASETKSLFTAREVPREASAILLVFAKAAEHWQANADCIEGLLRDLTPVRRATGR